MVNHLVERFAQCTVDPVIRRKLALILTWTSLPFKQRIAGKDSHANLLILDYRARKPPYDVYIIEPYNIEDVERTVVKAKIDYGKNGQQENR